MKAFGRFLLVFWLSTGLHPAFSDAVMNEALNAGFETPAGSGDAVPDDWQAFTSKEVAIGLGKASVHAGAQSLTLSAQGRAEAHVGIFQLHKVETGSTYLFEAHVRNDRLSPITDHVYGMLGIEWYDVKGREIGRVASQVWTRSLSRMRWELVKVKGQAPPGAVRAHFAVTLLDGASSGGRGSVHVDDVEKSWRSDNPVTVIRVQDSRTRIVQFSSLFPSR